IVIPTDIIMGNIGAVGNTTQVPITVIPPFVKISIRQFEDRQAKNIPSFFHLEVEVYLRGVLKEAAFVIDRHKEVGINYFSPIHLHSVGEVCNAYGVTFSEG